MDNWDIKKQKKSYKDIIPQTLIEGWMLDYVILTTYSFQQKQLNQLLYEIGAFSLIPEGRVHVFYDKNARNGKKYVNEDNIISEGFLHGVNIIDNDKTYAFHPKVCLLRYIKDKNVRYLVIISSRNISYSDLLDVYSVAYGDVTDGHKQESVNGVHLAGFLKNIMEKCNNNQEENLDQFVISELETISFSNDGKTPVTFYNSREVWEKIKDDSKSLIIISPFLSDKVVIDCRNKIKTIISTEQGFSMLDKAVIEELLNENKLKLFNSCNRELHAKIYCFDSEQGNYYIVGSSNATNNGCNIFNGSNGNIEYNMGFAVPECIESFIEDYTRSFTLEEYYAWKEKESDKFDAKRAFMEFCKNFNIECKHGKDKGSYRINIFKKNKFVLGLEDNAYKIQLSIGEEYKCLDEKLSFECQSPVPILLVKIINNKADMDDDKSDNIEASFALSIYYKWNNEDKDKIDKQCNEAYIRLQEHLQQRIIEGKANPRLSFPGISVGDSAKRQGGNLINKVYVHEELMKLAQSVNGEQELIQKLNQLKQLADNILRLDKENEKQKQIREIITRINEI